MYTFACNLKRHKNVDKIHDEFGLDLVVQT